MSINSTDSRETYVRIIRRRRVVTIMHNTAAAAAAYQIQIDGYYYYSQHPRRARYRLRPSPPTISRRASSPRGVGPRSSGARENPRWLKIIMYYFLPEYCFRYARIIIVSSFRTPTVKMRFSRPVRRLAYIQWERERENRSSNERYIILLLS